MMLLKMEFNLDDARAVWKEEDKAEGAREKQIEIAKNLIDYGCDVDIIVKSTGLSIEEVENLRAM